MDAEVRTERQADRGRSLAAVILGNDAIAAIRPCTPAQLARACVAAGFDIVVPPSWGDELVAAAYLEQMADRLEYAIAPCACALVRSMLDRSSANNSVGCAFAAAPPVAAARYVRAKYGEAVLITYVGDCPSASDPAIDARFSPAGFLASLNRQGISVEDQPTDTVTAEADRWRRHRSTPGGVPALRYLARAPINRVLRDADADTLTVGLPESRSNIVVDLSIAANCVCSGAGANLDEFEPPRSQTPIVVAPNGLDLSPAPSQPRVRPTLRARPEPDAGASAQAMPDAVEPAPPIVEHSAEIHSINRTVRPAPRPTKSMPREVKPPRSRRQRIALLALAPAVVLIVATALGIGVYQAVSSGEPESASPRAIGVETRAPTITDSLAARTPDSSMGLVPTRSSIDSARARLDTAADSSRRRRRAAQVIPGWLPQGQPTLVPADTSTRPRRDTIKPDTLQPDTARRA